VASRGADFPFNGNVADEVAMTRRIKVAGRYRTARKALGEFWGWLSGTGYRPERHYMRGGRQSG
jgi:hypothetical protein